MSDDIEVIFKTEFDADLCSISLQDETPMEWVFDSHGGLIASTPMSGQRYHLQIVLRQSRHRALRQEYPAHDLLGYVKHGSFVKILKQAGTLQSTQVTIESPDSVKIILEFLVFDYDGFISSLKDFRYKLYSEAFDQVVDETLKA